MQSKVSWVSNKNILPTQANPKKFFRNSPEMIGRHPAFVSSKRQVEAAGSLRILLHGETGTGKTPFARHSNLVLSNRSARPRPFEQLNCACLNPEHFQDLLFGHKKGAFTGAIADKKGLVELADGGDLFLDEIGDMPVSTQAHFLTFLDTQEYYRLGDDRKRHADVRIVCATNRDLKAMVERGHFRRDLYSRISQIVVRIPPLRERKSDIPLLVESFIEHFSGYAKPCDPDLLDIFMSYPWLDGNVRELKDTVEYLCTISKDDGVIRASHLGDRFLNQGARGAAAADADSVWDDTASLATVYEIGLEAYVQQMERKMLEKLLAANDGCMENLARQLKTSRSTLYRKIKKHEGPLKEFTSELSFVS